MSWGAKDRAQALRGYPPGFEGRVAVGYHRGNFVEKPNGALAKTEYAGRGYKVPNGGIFTTPGDLARFIMAQYSDSDRLAKNFREMMQTVQTPGTGKNGYGFGLFVSNPENGSKIVGHDGAVAGFTASMLFDPGLKIGAIVMRNRDVDVDMNAVEVRYVVERLGKVELHR